MPDCEDGLTILLMAAPRSIGSGTITFGLVSIPFKLFTATSPKSVSFNMLHKSCGSRLKQQLLCPVDNVVVERSDTVRGFEYARDQYVKFTDEELKKMEAARTGMLSLQQFVPSETVDRLFIEKTYFIGPDKGGDRAYQLLSVALAKKNAVAVGRFAQRGKDNLVIVAPSPSQGLLLHQCFYADEVRSIEDVDIGGKCEFKENEVSLARTLIEQLWKDRFSPADFRDSWIDTVKAAVDAKVAGEEIVTADAPPKQTVMDLLAALQKSVAANATQLETAREEVGATKGPKKATPRRSKRATQTAER